MQSVIKGYDSFYAKLSGPINIPGSIQIKYDDKDLDLGVWKTRIANSE